MRLRAFALYLVFTAVCSRNQSIYLKIKEHEKIKEYVDTNALLGPLIEHTRRLRCIIWSREIVDVKFIADMETLLAKITRDADRVLPVISE